MEKHTRLNQPLFDVIAIFEADQFGFDITKLNVETYLELIHHYEEQQQYDKAISVSDTAIKYYSGHSEFLVIKTKMLLFNNSFAEALSCIEKAEVMNKDLLEIKLIKIQVLSLLGEIDKAILLANQLASKGTKEELAIIYLTESYIYENTTDYETMYNTLYKAAVLDPLNDDILNRLWNTIQTSRYYYKGIKLYNRLIDIQPFSYLAWYHLGNAYLYVGEYDKAIDAMEYSFLIKEDFEEGYLEFAELCIQEKQYNRALNSYLDVLNLVGEDTEILTNIGNCYFLMKDYQTAEQYFLEAIEYDNYDDHVHYLTAKNYIAMGNPQKAIESLKTAIELDDEIEEYYYMLAKAYRINNDIAKALRCYRTATKICPEQSFFWKKYVEYLVDLKMFKKAIEATQIALEYTYDVELNYYQATLQITINNRKEGFELLESALKEDFDKHVVIFSLNNLLKEDKDLKSLIGYFYRELNPIFK